MNAVQENIYTNGEYLEKNPTWDRADSKWKAAVIDALMKKNGLAPQTVIEVGCGFGEILVQLSLLNSSIKKIKGFDISPQAIAEAKKSESDKVSFYNEDFTTILVEEKGLVLVIDVVEHVQDYLEFLKKIRERGDEFIFHIPLDLSCRTIIKSHILLQQREDVGHIHYFTFEHVKWILKDCGYTMVDWVYTFPDIDRKKPKSFRQWVKKQLRKFSFFISKKASVKLWGGYSVMVYCKKHE